MQGKTTNLQKLLQVILVVTVITVVVGGVLICQKHGITMADVIGICVKGIGWVMLGIVAIVLIGVALLYFVIYILPLIMLATGIIGIILVFKGHIIIGFICMGIGVLALAKTVPEY